MLLRIGVAFLLFFALKVFKEAEIIEGMEEFPKGFVIYLIPYFVIGWDILYKAAPGL